MKTQIYSLILPLFLLTSCQITVADGNTDSETQSDTNTEAEIIAISTSSILLSEVSVDDYSLNINQSNYVDLYPSYNGMFIQKHDLFTLITEGEPDASYNALDAVLETYTDIYKCPVSGELTMYQEFEVSGNNSVLIYEEYSTDQCFYEDDFEVNNFEYNVINENNIYAESFSYINEFDEVISVDSAYTAQGDNTIFEAYVNHQDFGRYFIRVTNEYEINQEVAFYGSDESSAVLLDQTHQKDPIEPCFYQNMYVYSLNEAPAENVDGDWVDDCVSGFNIDSVYNYSGSIVLPDELSEVSFTLAVASDNTTIRSVFTSNNDDSIIELTILKGGEQIFHQIGHVITDPIISLDRANYQFYIRGINFDFAQDEVFYQIKTEQSFVDNITVNIGPDFYIDEANYLVVTVELKKHQRGILGIESPLLIHPLCISDSHLKMN